jgi:hypothetical protein
MVCLEDSMRQTEPLGSDHKYVVVVGAGVWLFQNISRRSTPLCSRAKVGLDDQDGYRQ